MNEEEKKTIEKFIEKCYKYDESVEIKGISVGEEYRMLNTVCKALNLIEKLQKENEELKNQEATARRINELLVQRYSNSIPVQKVKDKIEELDIKISECEYSDDDDEEYKKAVEKDKLFLLNQKRVLQELLEKEHEDD